MRSTKDIYIRLLAATLSYGSILLLFVQAIISPLSHISFMYGFGLFIYLSEFLSIHSAALFSGKTSRNIAFSLVGFYAAVILLLSIQLETYYPALIFILSLVARSAIMPISFPGHNRNIKHGDILIITSIFLLSTMFVAIFNKIIAQIIVFPPIVYSYRPANSSGLFVDAPQLLLFWGILYYSLLLVWQLVNIYLYSKMHSRK